MRREEVKCEPKQISVGIWESLDQPRQLTKTELEYQQLISELSNSARNELKALLLLGRDGPSDSVSWNDQLRIASYHDKEDADHYKNWLWDRCDSFNELARGCSAVLCSTN